MKDYYCILGVDRGARPEEIVEAFFRLSRKYHPLVNPTPKARWRMREIAEAWDVLGDSRSRALYDRQRRAEMSPVRAALETFGRRINIIPGIFQMGAGLAGGVWKSLFPVAVALVILAVVYTPVLIGARSYAAAQMTRPAGIAAAASPSGFARVPNRTPAQPVLSRVVVLHETEPAAARRTAVAAQPTLLSTSTSSPTRVATPTLEATAVPLEPTLAPSLTSTTAPTRVPPTAVPPATATRATARYPAPSLLGPASNTSYSCPQDLVLSWSLGGAALQPDQWFMLETRQTDHAEWFAMTDWTRDSSVTLHPSSVKGGCEAGWWRGPGVYEWRVRVVGGDRATHTIQQYLSDPSAAAVIINKH